MIWSNAVRTSAAVCCALLLHAGAETASAQPVMSSSDVIGSGAGSFQLNFTRALDAPAQAGWSLYTAKDSYGFPYGVELSLGATYLSNDDLQALAVAPGIKWRFLNCADGVSAAVGGATFVSLMRSHFAGVESDRRWGTLFTVVQKNFGERKPIVAAGSYVLVGVREVGETRGGVVSSVTEVLSPSLTIATEWISGDNWFGYLSPVATFTIRSTSIGVGYSRGNRPRANSGPSLSFALGF